MKLLHLIRTTDPATGGPVSYLHSISAALADEPVRSQLMSLRAGPVDLAADWAAGASDPSQGTLWALPNPWRWLRVLRGFDLIHIHGIYGWHAVVGGWCARVLGVPYVVSSHGHVQPWGLRTRSWKKVLFRRLIGQRLFRSAQCVIASTSMEAQAVQQWAPGCRTVTITPGLSINQATHTASASRAGVRLLFLGRLHPHKGLEVALHALAALGPEHAAQLDIVGGGEALYVAELKARVAELGLSPQVVFHGAEIRQRADAHLRQADLLVLPSYGENFGYAVAEALCSGVPVITTDQVALAETIRAHGAGRVVPAGSAERMADAIRELADPTIRSAAAESARTMARDAFDMASFGRALVAAYQGAWQGSTSALQSPIVLIGPARSGTTMLGAALAAHPDLAYWIEPKYLWRYGAAGCPHDRRDAEQASPAVRRYIRSQFDRFVRRAGGRRLLEKTPSNCFRLAFVHRVLPDARIIYLSRDGRDVTASAYRKWTSPTDRSALARRLSTLEIPGREWPYYLRDALTEYVLRRLRPDRGLIWGPRFEGIREYREQFGVMASCLEQWRRSVAAAQADLQHVPEKQVLRVRYEELVADPQQGMHRILEFCGLSVDATVLQRAQDQMHAGQVGAWQTLPAQQRHELESLWMKGAEP